MLDDKGSKPTAHPEWTFLSNHAGVFLCLAKEPELRLREVAERVGITERAVQRIVADLEEGGYLSKCREGRRNHYRIHPDRPFRRASAANHDIGKLLEIFLGPAVAGSSPGGSD